MTISPVIGVNPLQTTLLELGIVSGRVALLLRSAEIQPVFIDLSNYGPTMGPYPPQHNSLVCKVVLAIWFTVYVYIQSHMLNIVTGYVLLSDMRSSRRVQLPQSLYLCV